MTASGGAEGRMRSNANLRPWQPGQSGNPSGTNQYTYRRDYENELDKLLAGTLTEDVLSFVPESTAEKLRALRETMSAGQALAHLTLGLAFSGDDKHLPELLKRVHPVTERHQVESTTTVVEVRDYSGERNGAAPNEIEEGGEEGGGE